MILYSMEQSKLPRRKMSKTNTRTRTIGTNTENKQRENNLLSGKCMKCHEKRNIQFVYPCYFPLPIAICSCMANCLQNNCVDIMNNCCKCENSKTDNMPNSPNFFKTCSSHSESSSSSNEICSSCKNSVTTVANNDVKEQNERKVVSPSLRSARHVIKEEPVDYESDEDVPNITKYANDFLESNYRYKYESTPKTENTNLKEDSKNISTPHSSKHLLNHLLKPNTTKNIDKTAVIEEDEEEDLDDLIELDEKNEGETIFEDDDLSVTTVIRPSGDGIDKLVINIDKEKTVQVEERRPTRVNISHQNSSIIRPQSQPVGNKKPRPSEEEMFMMLKALVTTTQYNNNSERLNTILSHIGDSKKHENKKSNNGSRCSSPKSTSPRKKNKVYASIIPKLSDIRK